MTAAQGAGSAIPSVCAGEQTGYKILVRWQRHQSVVSTMAPTIEEAVDNARNFLTDEFESEEYHHVTDDQVVKVVIRPLTKEEASEFCCNIVKDDEII